MILVDGIVEFGDELLILFGSCADRKNVHAANHRGGDHFAPFGFCAGHAGFGGAVIGQILPAIAFFQKMFEFVGSKERAIAGVFDAVEVNVERDDVPLVGLVFANVDVIAHDGAEFTWAAEPKFYRGFRADAGEKDGAMAGAADAVEVFVEGFVEDDADVGGGARNGDLEQQEGEWQREHEPGRQPATGGRSAEKSAKRSCSTESRHGDRNPMGLKKLPRQVRSLVESVIYESALRRGTMRIK